MEVQNLFNRHEHQIETAIASPAASALVASWRRSIGTHGLDPAEFRPPQRIIDTQLKAARRSIEPLIRVADGVLEQLFRRSAAPDAASCSPTPTASAASTF